MTAIGTNETLTRSLPNDGFAAIAARNPEFLHQYRVGLRRLRSAFGLFRPVLAAESAAALVREMRWLGARLGPARDWDVFCERALEPLYERAGRDPGFAALRRCCVRERAACAAKVREANVAAVALANKTARIAWAMIKNGTDYHANLVAQ
jgi:CHAD domain-containing protein